MRHSSKNAIPTKPQKQPAIAQNFHIKKSEGKKRESGEGREKKGASEAEGEEREKREVPVVAAVVLVCLPADEPQGSHGTFKARRRRGGEGRRRMEKKEKGMERGGRKEEEEEESEKRRRGRKGSKETKIASEQERRYWSGLCREILNEKQNKRGKGMTAERK